MSDFVYVIGSDAGPQKIGVANNVGKRLDALQTGCPFDLKVHHAEAVDGVLRRKIEAFAHHLLSHRRLRGEWFDVTPDAAIATVQRAKDDIENNRPAAPAQFRDPRDGLIVAFRRGDIDRRLLEAGLAYREIRDKLAARAHCAQSGNGSAAWGMTRLLHKIEGEVIRRAELPAAIALLRVAYRTEPVGKDLQKLKAALEVVAQLLDEKMVA